MQIRQATETDIPEIVNLLKVSLGEKLMEKSERYWRWKHIENPFGPSPVLLCFEGSTLIGVRAFMRWEWMHRGKIIKALRAVDTATHPDHQGKGIFKTLTLSLVDLCKKNGDHFIFNTPNGQSKPGYLKMGWEEAGRLPITLNLQRPARMVANYLGQSASPPVDETTWENHYLDHAGLQTLISAGQHESIRTNVSASYLKWRYLDVPVARYFAIGTENHGQLVGLIIFRIKGGRLGSELRIVDCFLKNPSEGDSLRKKLMKESQSRDIDYRVISGNGLPGYSKLVGRLRFKVGVGPLVTIRDIAFSDFNMLRNFKNWSPSLGDLELF